MLDIFNLLWNNKEWLFSGIGLAVIGFIPAISHWFHKQNTEPKMRQITDDNSVNIQIGDNLTGTLVTQSKESIAQAEESIAQSRKEQQISRIEKRLEKFYYPLSQRLGDYRRTGSTKCIDDFNALLEETSSFLYLACSKEVKDTFTQLRDYQRHPFKGQNELDNVDTSRDHLLFLVNRDIEKLEIKLEELT